MLNDDRLLSAGRAVFLSRGFHGASLDRVSAAAGLTKGAVYARFSSKAELFLTLLDAHVQERVDEARAAAQRSRTARGAVRAVMLQWIERADAQRDWALLTLEFRLFAVRDPALLRRYRAVHARLRSGMAQVAQEVAERTGEHLPLSNESLVSFMLALGHGVVLERWVDDSEDYEALLKRLLPRLLDDGQGERA